MIGTGDDLRDLRISSRPLVVGQTEIEDHQIGLFGLDASASRSAASSASTTR